MSEDRPEDIESPADSGRAKRPPPTIDLEATEVSGETRSAGAGAKPKRSFPRPSAAAVSAAIIAAVTGAGAAALVMAVAFLLGWPGEAAPRRGGQHFSDQRSRRAYRRRRIKDQQARRRRGRSGGGKPSRRAGEIGCRIARRARGLARAVGQARSQRQCHQIGAARGRGAADLAAINERIAQLERAIRAQSSAIAEGGAKPADDVPLRRIVAAALLDVLVRSGEPYPAALTAAKALAPNPDALKPLDGFAATGVPNAFNLSRELLALVPKLSPPPETSTTGADLVGRLRAGAEKLVRIERTDAATGNDRGAIVARVTAAALRSDLIEARRELKTLPPPTAPPPKPGSTRWMRATPRLAPPGNSRPRP